MVLDLVDRDADGGLLSHYVLLVKRAELAGAMAPGDDALAVQWLDAAGLEAVASDVTATTLAVAERLLVGFAAPEVR
ncbi:hypothetical protein ACGTN6_08410 [Halomonas sp. THAF12]|uniref:hypothetical protein n=1 Tax=Halomonas sp. B23F22_10 TaxID=3459515 RepID=UPI00373E87ED